MVGLRVNGSLLLSNVRPETYYLVLDAINSWRVGESLLWLSLLAKLYVIQPCTSVRTSHVVGIVPGYLP